MTPFFFSIISEKEYFINLYSNDIREGIVPYIMNNSAGPRLAYAISGFRVFTQHQWTGVGLGTSGFYMINNLPNWAKNLQEIFRSLAPETFQFMNPKNLYVRLLAETGLVGFWLFISFMFSVLSKVIQMLNTKSQDAEFIGIVGVFAWIVMMLRFFTNDSLTFPVMWMMLGMILGFSAKIEEKGFLDETR